MWQYHCFYHGCNNLTNLLAQNMVDKSHINLQDIYLQVIYQPVNAAHA